MLRLLNAIQERFTREDFSILKATLQQIAVSNLLKASYEAESNTEFTTNHEYDIDSYIQSITLGKRLFMLYRSHRLQTWLKTVYKYVRQFTVRHSLWQLDKQIPIPVLPAQIAQTLFLSEKNILLNVVGLTQKDWKNSLRCIEDIESEYVYFGLNGIQVRYRQSTKIRFRTIKYRNLSKAVGLDRFTGLYVATTPSYDSVDLITWIDSLYKRIITAKYRKQIIQLVVRPVIAESITDLLAFAQMLYEGEVDNSSGYYTSLCDSENVSYLFVPAFNRGIITAYQTLVELFGRMRQSLTFDKMFILTDKDVLEFEIQVIHRAMQTVKLSKELIVLVPNDGKDYREARHCTSIRV